MFPWLVGTFKSGFITQHYQFICDVQGANFGPIRSEISNLEHSEVVLVALHITNQVYICRYTTLSTCLRWVYVPSRCQLCLRTNYLAL